MFLTPGSPAFAYFSQNMADEKHPDVVQENRDKLRSTFDENSDIFNIDVFPCWRVLRNGEK